MAYRLIDGSEFLHIPKTGGAWVRTILDENNLIVRRLGHAHLDYDRNLFYEWSPMSGQGHLQIAMKRAKKRLFYKIRGNSAHDGSKPVFRFCFVRHPLRWYESWWKYMMGKGWQNWGQQNSAADWHVNSTLNGLGDDDFNTFVSNVVHARPGYVSELYYAFTKPGISFIGKTESLREDLQYVLDARGLEYSYESIYQKPRVNVSKAVPEKIEWDPQLKRTVTLLELPALIHFGYLKPEDFNALGISEKIKPNQAMEHKLISVKS